MTLASVLSAAKKGLGAVVKHPLLAVLVVLAGLLAAEHLALGRAEDAARTAALALDSAQAKADTTREVLAAWSDSARYWQRRAVQSALRADSLDRALRERPVVRTVERVAVAGLDTTAAGSAAPDTSARSARLVLARVPWHLDAQVVVPPPPAPSVWNVHLRLDTIPLSLRIGCGERPSSSAAYPASVTVRAPPWAALRLAGVQQDPAICNPASRPPAARRFLETPAFIAAGAGAGYAASRDLPGALLGGAVGLAAAELWRLVR